MLDAIVLPCLRKTYIALFLVVIELRVPLQPCLNALSDMISFRRSIVVVTNSSRFCLAADTLGFGKSLPLLAACRTLNLQSATATGAQVKSPQSKLSRATHSVSVVFVLQGVFDFVISDPEITIIHFF